MSPLVLIVVGSNANEAFGDCNSSAHDFRIASLPWTDSALGGMITPSLA
jgi:hypothetical protein